MAITTDARCPMCNAVIDFNEYHIFSVRQAAPALPAEMIVTERGETIHQCALPPALHSIGDPSPQRFRSL